MCTSRSRLCVVMALVVSACVVGPAQAKQLETIPDAIARGATGRVSNAPSGRPPAVAALLHETDLIVRGRVGSSSSRLSDDRRNVYTDFTVDQPTVLFARQALESSKPGALPQLVISQLGGVITYAGTMFTQKEDGLAPFQEGEELIVLLRRDGSHWTIVGQVLGAFGVKDGKVSPLTTVQSFAAEYRAVPVSLMVDNVVAQALAAKR